ncbi:hypothetical protein MAPG_11915 [Magnaporthiopsis poae ATCC 64411]|uniref:Uncharacterized protein n=1 Tax=Magnaporthiopsis poae (strain ATCC 64411 / 73-15) TaxID=644358 RepID=A0A0C4EGH1_MAGP6|nr:hypothetical protein MAPG_11915 [Magnaporthiopsis poae ATCC 64411]
MTASCRDFTQELARFAEYHANFVSRQDLTDILRPMLDGLKSDIYNRLAEMETRITENSAISTSASGHNLSVRAVNAAITSRDQALTPLYSLSTGERIMETGKTLNELADIEPENVGALLKDLGLPTTGSDDMKKERLLRAMGRP